MEVHHQEEGSGKQTPCFSGWQQSFHSYGLWTLPSIGLPGGAASRPTRSSFLILKALPLSPSVSSSPGLLHVGDGQVSKSLYLDVRMHPRVLL